MIINDREYKDDLYDTLEAEFESVWNASYRYPGTWIEGRKSVFLSYSEQDRILAGEICERFRDKQIDCFMACHDLSPGEIWTDELRRKLCHSIEFVALLTPQSASSRWVLAELGAAWALGMNITPALVQVKVTDLPHFVGSRQAIDVSTTDGKQKLVDAVSERMLREFWTLRCAQGPTVTEI